MYGFGVYETVLVSEESCLKYLSKLCELSNSKKGSRSLHRIANEACDGSAFGRVGRN